MYETGAIGAVAERIVKANKARTCELIAGHSTDMIDPPRADIVVSETLGNYAFEENIIATVNDAVTRHLKPGGTIIPKSVTQFAAPVISDRIHAELSAWDHVGASLGIADGFDLSVARAMSANNAYVRWIEAGEFLDGGRSAVAWDAVDLGAKPSSNRKGEAHWTIGRPVTVYGFATWWTAQLSAGLAISTSPLAPRTHWEQLYFPVASPMAIAPGQRVSVALRSRSSEEGGTHLAWTATHEDVTGRKLARQAHDLDKGYLP